MFIWTGLLALRSLLRSTGTARYRSLYSPRYRGEASGLAARTDTHTASRW
jgi:hypothetical protein